MDKLKEIVADQIRSEFPTFKTGDRIRVHVKVIEGDKERIQPYEGDVLSIRGTGLNKTFIVRKISSGVGVERIFSFNSPKITKVEIVKEGRVRRAKLFYLRKLSGKAARIKDKNVK
ncbi:MAG: 50S ribosomal protein L19 [Ignavibacteria bacterium RBG_13_36_8]|nr:MAG: 50S ribosomal protein L19 [Ignavibacteria bacterium RBG_13_36_8]